MAPATGNGERIAPGTVLGRYEIGRQLGRGGMGAVYEAVHRDLRKQVAVKVLSKALASDEIARQRFVREGEAASRIRHPHVVDVTDVGTEGEYTYLVMELLQGEDLATRIQRGVVAPQEAVDLMLPVIAGVHAAHQEGIVHRDLKPENIFLARQRQGGIVPKVLDFGVSKLASDGRTMALTGTAAVFGTPFYMPPEQIRGARQADHKSDQYALAVVLYETLTGRRPYEGQNVYAILHAIGAGEFPRPRAVRAEIPEALDAAIVRAMSLNPADRFSSVAEFGAVLLPLAGETARLVWTSTFSSAINAAASTAVLEQGPDPQPPPVADAQRGSVSGTRVLESPGQRTGTTLGAATGQKLGGDIPPRSKAPAWIAGIAVVLALGAGASFLLSRPAQVNRPEPAPPPAMAIPAPPPEDEPTPPTFSIDVVADPPNSAFELDGKPAGIGRLQRTLPKDGTEHRLVVRAAGHRDTEVLFADHPPPRRLNLTVEPSAASGTDAVARSPGADEHHRRRRLRGGHFASPPAENHEPAISRTANGAPVLD
jgi:eukaryotic-like serine/threonine-protein kinase